MRIFLDANILFSAARVRPGASGAVRDLVERLLEAGHEGVASSFVILEARRNLEIQSPAGARSALAALDALVARLDIVDSLPGAVPHAALERLPEKDRPVLAAAIGGRCAALLTGDRRHFGALFGEKLGGVRVHSPASLAEEML